MAFIPPIKPGEEFKNPARGERLQRFMADQGIASRRACEQLIREGRVTVNGIRVTDLPIFVDTASDHVNVDGRGLATISPKARETHEYVMLNKPSRVLCATKDEPGLDRTTVMELVRHHSGKRLFPVGRLDWETMGLIILTDDGELANRLTHPRYNIPKVYEVAVKGLLSPNDLEKLRKDLRKFEKQVAKRAAGAGPTAVSPVEVDIVTQDSQRTLLRITMRESRNREVREMIAAAGLTIRKVERVAIGPVNLGGLRTGAWRDLDRDEVKALYQASGGEAAQERTSISTRSMGSFRPVRAKRPVRSRAEGADVDREVEVPVEKKPVFRPSKKSVKAESQKALAPRASTGAPARTGTKERSMQDEPRKKGPRVIGPRSY